MKATIKIAVIFLVVGGTGFYSVTKYNNPHSVEYYLEHAKARKAVLKKCDMLNPLKMMQDENCMNAASAKSKQRMNRVLGGYKPSSHPGVPLKSY